MRNGVDKFPPMKVSTYPNVELELRNHTDDEIDNNRDCEN